MENQPHCFPTTESFLWGLDPNRLVSVVQRSFRGTEGSRGGVGDGEGFS